MRRTALAALAAAALVSSCSGDPGPKAEPTHSPATPSSSSPAQARQSVKHFIREWVKADTRMQNTGATDDYLAMSSGCAPCKTFAKKVAQDYARGAHIRTLGWELLAVHNSGLGTFRIKVNSRPTTFVPSPGAKAQHFEGGPATYLVTLERHGDTWTVSNLIGVPS